MKKAAVGASAREKEDDNTRFLVLLAKPYLWSALQTRCLRRIIVDVFRVSVDNIYVVHLRAETQAWEDNARALSAPQPDDKEDEIWLPRIHGCNGLLKALKIRLKEKAQEQQLIGKKKLLPLTPRSRGESSIWT